MKTERGWTMIPDFTKQEAIDLRGRNLTGLRHGGEAFRFLVTRKKEQERWNLVKLPMATFSLLHEEWLAERLRGAILAMRDCIEATPDRLGGVPVFRGTRFSVSQFIAELADGEGLHEVADNYEMDEDILKNFLHALAVWLNKPAPR